MPDKTTRARVVSGEFRYDREHYTAGDELDVHEDALEKHPRTLERVDDGDVQEAAEGSASDDGADGVTVDDLDPHPEDLTIDDLEDRVADVDDRELLKTIREAEVGTQDRSGAKDAIDARLDELEG